MVKYWGGSVPRSLIPIFDSRTNHPAPYLVPQVTGQTPNGHRFRTLNVVDDFTRECLAIEVDFSMPGKRVTRVLQRLVLFYDSADCIAMDNGPELTGRAMIAWCMQGDIALEYIRPGKPIENAFVESFNGKFRDEGLNENWFLDLNDARSKIEDWREDYNTRRPHGALGYLTPKEFAGSINYQPASA